MAAKRVVKTFNRTQYNMTLNFKSTTLSIKIT